MRILLLILLSHPLFAQWSVMTYNIRYDNPQDGVNRWDNRKAFVRDQVQFHEPDFLGIQEGLHHQVQYLDEQLKDYTFTGVGRDDGKSKGEYCAIFHKKDIQITGSGTFWLSDTPASISVGWDAALERICTYVKGQRGKEVIWVFNTHFDHIGEVAREKSAWLIIQKINELVTPGESVILMGDLNLEPDSKPISYIKNNLNDSHRVSAIRLGPAGTWNGFQHDITIDRRIDYIFTSKNLQVLKYAVLSDSDQQRYPSDHLPVIAVVK